MSIQHKPLTRIDERTTDELARRWIRNSKIVDSEGLVDDTADISAELTRLTDELNSRGFTTDTRDASPKASKDWRYVVVFQDYPEYEISHGVIITSATRAAWHISKNGEPACKTARKKAEVKKSSVMGTSEWIRKPMDVIRTLPEAVPFCRPCRGEQEKEFCEVPQGVRDTVAEAAGVEGHDE